MKTLSCGLFAFLFFTFSSANAQLVQQGSKLVGTGAVGAATQGYSVSLSADGNTAIIGGYNDNNHAGAAWVYILSGGVWTQQGSKLVGTGAVGAAEQGYSVSLSVDGNTAIVGGQTDNSIAGAAWVYTRSGGVWTQQGSKLVGTGAVGVAGQGFSVSLSSDGNTAIIGGFADNSYAGAAWVYTRSGGVWTQQGSKLVGTGAVGAAWQGSSVSLSSDGNTAIVGALGDNSSLGAAWVYTRSGGVWAQQGSKLVGAGAVGAAHQGYSVSLSADGNTAIVSGSRDNSNAGAAWVYTRSGGVWTQQGSKLVGTGAVGAPYQGYSVSLSADGNTAIVGGYGDNSSLGAAWVYTRSGGVWTQQGSKLVGTGAVGAAEQGTSVSLSADGNVAIVGGVGDNSGAGATWVYRVTGSPVINTISDIPNDQGGQVRINWNKSPYDNSLSSPQTTAYGIWRKIPALSGAKTYTPGTMQVANDTLGMLYDFLGSVIAVQSPEYNFVASTLADSDQSGNHMEMFLVTAHTADPNVYWISISKSGYSVDNIQPLAPRNLAIAVHSDTVVLHWNPNSEPDLGRYAVYRSPDSITNVSSLQPYAYSTDTIFVDTTHVQNLHYLVRAEDIHNNLSPSSNQVQFGITGVSENGNGIPTSFALEQNYPNPFNPTTVITYALPEQSFVRLTVYNVLGQEVATLVNELQNVGNKSVEFNGNNFPSGIYFYKVTARTFSQVKKMILLK